MTRALRVPDVAERWGRGLRQEDAARFIGIQPSGVERWCERHKVRPIRMVDEYVYDRRDLERVIGTVYVVACGGFLKIGWSRDPKARLRQIQRGLPEPLALLATFTGKTVRFERRLHQRFRFYRSRGEWFRIEGALAAWVEEGCPHD